MSIRTDSELKAQAELVLSRLGMNMTGAINMFLWQIVRDRAVLPPPSLSPKQLLYTDLLRAKAEREQGVEGVPASQLLADIDRIIREAKSGAISIFGKRRYAPMSARRTCNSEEFSKLPDFIRAELIDGTLYTDDWTSLEVDEEVFQNKPSETRHVAYRLSVVKVEDVSNE